MLLTITDIALIHYYNYQTLLSSYVLINLLYNSYLPNTLRAITTGYNTRLGNQEVDQNTLYAKYSCGTQIISKYDISTCADVGIIFNQLQVGPSIGYTPLQVIQSMRMEINTVFSNLTYLVIHHL